ncbi:response regulator [uncultured Thiothrix sp.]|uniref:hybrid sensor histidine kinase/response regulator n=1 Tax=uncultured Thiothrix sp. TaxID=223185 RepID=UPI002639539F|nr:response regulator [uncultured Thiothrix sp.]HMT92758.1 response regulator [Thiolinea sp.]
MDNQLDLDRLAFAEELEEVALQLSMLDSSLETAMQLEQVGAEYERLGMTTEMYGWQDVLAVVNWASRSLTTSAAPELLAEGKYFGWLEMTALVLREPNELSHLPMLMAELMDANWPEPLDAQLLQQFLLNLRASGQAEQSELEIEPRVPAELTFAADVHPELLTAYLAETPGHITEAARLIRLVAEGHSSREQQRQASRLVHTIKGSSGVVGVEPIANFTHKLEDLLDAGALQTLPEGLGDTLTASADCLEALLEHLKAGSGLPDEYAQLDSDLSVWQTRLAQIAEEEGVEDELPTLVPMASLPSFLTEPKTEAVTAELVEEDEDLPSVPATPQLAGSMVVNEEKVARLLRLAGELITSSSQSAELLQQSSRMGKQLYQHDEQIRQRLDELETAIESQAQRQAKGVKTTQKDGQTLDNLELESYSDLVSANNLLMEAAADSHELVQNLQQMIRRLTDELYQQQRVQRQLSDAVLAMRLTPVSSLVPRLQRIVRETCRKTGKKAEIEIHGQHLQVDADIFKGVTDPLLHLLRNAVDHGIESPEERVAAGKAETGKIMLNFTQRGNHIALSLEDDGAGMELEKIRARGLERGLIHAEAELSEDALLRLVLQPGFSTRDEVSEVSGRGVGMDVVQAAVEKLRGTVNLSTQTGVGTKVVLDMPQTLISTHALVVRAGEHWVAVPADSIEQVLYVAANESIADNGTWRIHTNRYQLPVEPLAQLLHWPAPPVNIQQAHTMLIIRSETGVHALYANEVLPSRDIVIKSLAPWLSYLPGVQGACILANGIVAPVLDMIRLVRDLEEGKIHLRAPDEVKVVEVSQAASTILVVDDSLSNRKALRLILESMGHVVHTAVDGLDALQVINTTPVDMILTDMEMPRMNGLEMTQAIRIWPEMKDLPIIMITSRSTRKHRDLAEQAGVDGYLTKPVQTAALQEQIQKWLDTQLAIA